jgi:hypothetical protein
MTILVNVEGITFKDILPYLKNHEVLNDDYDDDERKKVYIQLEILFDKLVKGEAAENYVIGHYFADCLREMGRFLVNANHPYHDNDFYLQPITKDKLSSFLKGLK